MNVDDIHTLYAFNRWANRRLLDAAGRVAPPRFVQDLGTSHGSLRGTLVHILWAEWIWLRRWQGESPRQLFDVEDFTGADSLASRWGGIEREQLDFIAGLTEARLAARISYENLQGQRWEYSLAQMMQHVVNHSSYHRGQVVTLLRQLGENPPATDFLVFLDEAPAARSTASEVG